MSKEVLDRFGKIVTETVYDDAVSHFINLINGTTKWGIGKEYTEVFQKLSKSDQQVLLKYIETTIGTVIFGMLGIYEENPEFKLTYEENGERIDLVEASEMLKAEPTIEGGWIDRFSQFSDKKDKEV